MTRPSLREVLDGPFAAWMKPGGDWSAWRAFMFALRGEPLTTDELAIFQNHTGRMTAPTEAFTECFVVAGRRARKSAVAAILGVDAAVYGQWPRAQGEEVHVVIVAVDKAQAKIVRGFAQGLLESDPGLRQLIVASDTTSITLNNGIVIDVVANNWRSIRGRAVCCVIAEELAFWRDERSSNPDQELYRAIKPAMLNLRGALFLGISSPYARRGLLYEKYQRHFGRDDSKVLIWQASTQDMNPGVDAAFIEEAYADDPISASAEFGGIFRSDVEQFVALEVVEQVTDPGVAERPALSSVRYSAFVDPSGGSADSFTLAISHKEKETTVLDLVREVRAPFQPSVVVEDLCKVLKSYRITKVSGDRYAGEWPREQFKKHGIGYEPSEKNKSELYLTLLPMLNSGQVRLLDNERLTKQLVGLERRTARSGKESVDHSPQRGSRDDLANAVAGALVLCSARTWGPEWSLEKAFQTDGKPDTPEDVAAMWQRSRLIAHLQRFG